ncbi:S-methyl-5-thioribose-1-phosphate isomerase [Chloroflexota bacterium]
MEIEEVIPLEWLGDRIRILDQNRLPHEEVYLELASYQDIASAVVELKIRGAPLIGVVISYGLALGAQEIDSSSLEKFLERLRGVSQALAATRPTARNLFQALDRMLRVAQSVMDVADIKKALVEEAIKINAEEIEASRKLSRLGAGLLKDNFTILTHCNTGALATGGYGTALGVIKQASQRGKKVRVLATETRPLLQGARLTTWELKKAGIPVTLITDSMVGYFIRRGDVSCVIVGADRITANGDTANKIGTYTLAVLAREQGLPFYVAAPTTTIDSNLEKGIDIPIEERSPEEVTHIQGVAITPEGTPALNPAFDITPHKYITAIITEKGIIREPYREGINDLWLVL